MEDVLYLQRGLFKGGYKKFYAKVTESDQTFTLLKKNYKGQQHFKISLLGSNLDTQNLLKNHKVYPS